MNSSNHDVIAALTRWLQAGETVWLCTIVRTYGSSPRPAGSLMAVTERFGVQGSISGGCIEEDLIEQLQSGELEGQFASNGKPIRLKYGINQEEQARLALPCGGQLHVLVERIAPSEARLAEFSALLAALDQRLPRVREVDLDTGASRMVEAPQQERLLIDEQRLSLLLGPRYQLLLIGAGEVARYLADIAPSLDFSVTLCEPRAAFRKGWQVASAEVVTALPDDVVRQRFSDPFSAVVAVAHDPRVDDMALMAALKTRCFYVGAMGSERTSAARRERLRALDISSDELAALHAPIGFSIGSKTPAEIAVSILAELVAARATGHAERLNRRLYAAELTNS